MSWFGSAPTVRAETPEAARSLPWRWIAAAGLLLLVGVVIAFGAISWSHRGPSSSKVRAAMAGQPHHGVAVRSAEDQLAASERALEVSVEAEEVATRRLREAREAAQEARDARDRAREDTERARLELQLARWEAVEALQPDERAKSQIARLRRKLGR